ncbi:MAG: DUF2909 domain-containing protein [Alcanivorax sp.]|nr:DUF2909 domain-containing protein [Alcanivorax sp.]
MWWLKVLILLLVAAAVVSLFRGLAALMRSDGRDKGTARALTWRVGFSVAVFLLLVVSTWMGWIAPHDVNPTLRDGVPIEQSAGGGE